VPELPDIVAYVQGLDRHVVGHELRALKLASPFLVRSVEPPIGALIGRRVQCASRIGKRLVLSFEGEVHLVIHLMIAGRLRWRPPGGKGPGKALATLEFPHGVLLLSEAGTKRRASFTVVRGHDALAAIDRGGLEVLSATREAFAERLRRENHTLKRSLTDPRLFSGIGNAYSDEILHHARLSPLLTTARMTDGQIEVLFASTRQILTEWIDRLQREVGDGFPETVTAFRPEMHVHGRYGQPCPECGAAIQRIRYADNETNYCARCQTDGRLLADRSLSRLLKGDWPKSIDELEG
jgi:formamidopyrimidine-DNA glycosylase